MVQALPSLEPVGNFYHEKDPHDYTVHAFKRQLWAARPPAEGLAATSAGRP